MSSLAKWRCWTISIVAVVALCSPALAFTLVAAPPESDIYTLYYANRTMPGQRGHVASFDTKRGAAYNRENCELAAKLFEERGSDRARFWCERGLYADSLLVIPEPRIERPVEQTNPNWPCFMFNGKRYCE